MDPTLRIKLEALHQQLDGIDTVDDDSRALLVTLLGDISRLLDQRPAATEESLPDQLESVAVHFEAEHPSLSAAVRGVIDALARAGI